MTSLHQIVAIEKGTRSAAQAAVSVFHHRMQNKAALSGLYRTYQPKDEENGDRLPSESTRVQVTVQDSLAGIRTAWVKMFDVVATKDVANTLAKANVVIDGKVLATDVPATHLLFLEKQIGDLRTIIAAVPTLDPAFKWAFNTNTGLYETEPVETVRTKKILRNHVKAEATDRHPAQVDTYGEDVIVGRWTKVETSGAIPGTMKVALLSRVDTLLQAVRFAREKANDQPVTDATFGASVLDYALDPLRVA